MQTDFDPAVTLWPDVSSSRGAPMGRQSDSLANAAGCQVRLFRIPMVDSCYDPGGAYWGAGDSAVGFMFAWYCEESDSRGYFRAADSAAAIRHIAEEAPDSTIAPGVDVDAMAAGYFEALFFTDNAPQVWRDEWPEDGETQEGSIPDGLDESDIAEECHAAALRELVQFAADNAPTIAAALTRGYTLEQCGRDLWLTRNGHGAGFWDRKELDFRLPGHAESIGDELSAAARKAGQVDSYWDGERVRF